MNNLMDNLIKYCCLNGDLYTLKMIYDKNKDNFDVNAMYGGQPLLYYTLNEEHIDIIKYLITECTADVNIKASNGDTILIRAVEYGRYECIKVLLELGADSTLKNNRGFNALQVAHLKWVVSNLKNQAIVRRDTNVKINKYRDKIIPLLKDNLSPMVKSANKV